MLMASDALVHLFPLQSASAETVLYCSNTVTKVQMRCKCGSLSASLCFIWNVFGKAHKHTLESSKRPRGRYELSAMTSVNGSYCTQCALQYTVLVHVQLVLVLYCCTAALLLCCSAALLLCCSAEGSRLLQSPWGGSVSLILADHHRSK
jgi:hypothetical protein